MLVNGFNSNNDTFQPIQKVQFEKKKIKWESYDKEIICSYYTEPLSVELLDIDCKGGFPVMAETTRKLAASTR